MSNVLKCDDIELINLSKVHFADGSPLVEGAPFGFSDSGIENCFQNLSILRIVPSEGVIFSDGHSSEMSGTVRLTNISNGPVTYKIKTTSPEKFRVRPSLGILQMNCSASINVSVQPGFTGHSILRDKFLIMSFNTSLQNPTYADLSDLWKSTDMKKISQHRLKCSMAQLSSNQNGAAYNIALQSHSFESETDQKISQLISAVNHMAHHNEKIMSEIAYVSTLEKIIIILVLLLCIAVYMIYTKLPSENVASSYYSMAGKHCSSDHDTYNPD